MRITFVSRPPRRIFRLDEVDPCIEPALAAASWQQVDGGWQRDYPDDAPLLDQVEQTFATHAGTMFRQQAGLDPVPWEEALAAFAERASAAGISWWLTGSGATALRVDGIAPHDLDVMFDPDQAGLVRETFAGMLVQPLVDTGGWVARLFGVLFLHAPIDLAADPNPAVDNPAPADFGPYAAAHLEEVTWRGHVIRVPPLSLQADVNRRRGRHERAARIEAALTRTGDGRQ